MTGRAAMIAGVLLLAAATAAPASAQSTSTDNFEADPPENVQNLETAHAAYLGDGELQLERPEDLTPLEPLQARPRRANWISNLFRALAPLFKISFYLIVAVVILAIAYFLFGEAIRMRIGGFRKRDDKTPDDVILDFRPDAQAARSLLEEADALARKGLFAEAVRLLLFRSIEDIQTRVESGVPKSMTAREIGKLRQLPEHARSALSPIIRIVETSFFGGRPVDEPAWNSARSSYQAFAFGSDWNSE